MLPSAAVQVPRPAGAAAAPPVTRPRRHPLAPAAARGPAGRSGAALLRPFPLPKDSTEARNQSDAAGARRTPSQGHPPRPRLPAAALYPPGAAPPQRRPGAPPPGRLRAVSPACPFSAQPGSRRAWKGCGPIGGGRWQLCKALYEFCTATRAGVGFRSPVPESDPCPEHCSQSSRP